MTDDPNPDNAGNLPQGSFTPQLQAHITPVMRVLAYLMDTDVPE